MAYGLQRDELLQNLTDTCDLKGIGHQKIKIPSSFNHPHVVPNP